MYGTQSKAKYSCQKQCYDSSMCWIFILPAGCPHKPTTSSIDALINFRDIIRLLKEKRRDSLDDGYVVGHKRLSEVEDKEKQKLMESEE